MISFRKAIFYSAFLFTIIHDHKWFNVFIIGSLFGYIYLKTRNIYITIGLHSLNNLSHYFLEAAHRLSSNIIS